MMLAKCTFIKGYMQDRYVNCYKYANEETCLYNVSFSHDTFKNEPIMSPPVYLKS